MKRWRHVIINTRSSWLHGDPRGFRSREHRIHSSGDYRNRPPVGEHAELHAFHLSRSTRSVSIDNDLRVVVICNFVKKLKELEHRIIACSCGDKHVHAIAELPREWIAMKREVGKAKQKVSHAIRDRLPGSMWASGGTFKAIADLGHFRAAYDYVRLKQEAGSVVWAHRDDEDWIGNPTVGVVIMRSRYERIRVFGVPQTPASEL